MLERVLIGILAVGLSDRFHSNFSEENSHALGLDDSQSFIAQLQPSSKFHIGMLSISLIVGLAYGIFVAYCCWMEENIFLSYIRNLVISLVFRTFFTILFDGIIILGSFLNVRGGNTLLAFENISQNLVLAFWLLLTIYLHARMQGGFNNQPTLNSYNFGVPGIAIFFSLVWIFSMEGVYGNRSWWLVDFSNPATQWISKSLRLLYLLLQLGLILDIGKTTMKKSSLDNDTISLLRKVAVLFGSLIFLFWLYFGFSVGRPSINDMQPYLYFFYFVDGLLCALVCPIAYFLNKWVVVLLNDFSSVLSTNEEKLQRPINKEVLLSCTGNQSTVAIDSLFMTQESERWRRVNSSDIKDIVYSSIIQPENLKKTFNLYKRLNIIQKNENIIIGREKFHKCDSEYSETSNFDGKTLKYTQNTSFNNKKKETSPKIEKNKFNNDIKSEKIKKKNAFYSSKYLILDSKKNDFSIHEDFPKTEKCEKDLSSEPHNLLSNEFVGKWLNDCSKNKEKKNQDDVEIVYEEQMFMSKKKCYDSTKKIETETKNTTNNELIRNEENKLKILPSNERKYEKVNETSEKSKLKDEFSKTEAQSDSEFDMEKFSETSSSSGPPFSLDAYYLKAIENNAKLNRNFKITS